MSDLLIDTLESKLEAFEDNSWPLNTSKNLINSWRNGYVWNNKRYPAGRMSEKQVALVERLIKEADEGKPERDTADVGSFERVCHMFAHAKSQKLKFPKIELLLGQFRVRLYAAGPNSKNAGHIQVKSPSRYFGHVSPEGVFTFFGHTDQDEALLEALRQFGADPVRTAARYGKITGNCCFCRKPVGEGKDKRSVKEGYGPQCAEKWDLPWGNKIRGGYSAFDKVAGYAA